MHRSYQDFEGSGRISSRSRANHTKAAMVPAITNRFAALSHLSDELSDECVATPRDTTDSSLPQSEAAAKRGRSCIPANGKPSAAMLPREVHHGRLVAAAASATRSDRRHSAAGRQHRFHTSHPEDGKLHRPAASQEPVPHVSFLGRINEFARRQR